ncbi:hypothetical protein [Candidatus Williamhamiltonella defendens]|uniref:Uncharacterized protein n=1 Tax=Hamiltonella defensa subsp. Acyrthosiphon pisum (strain 5AT) TaxID=572265 RepID=C4K483_HAMD5|nr:hypothetical protein [Candidatus Hamiltonella defensa]ACQ67376.1 hypothetical protein HDEF_0635 [Candidatus Hamiltonella defensa 5AT (Acyrthosiphon pisum)]
MLTVKMLRRYRVWANEALQLLQLGDAHRQLEPLSGQEALIKSQGGMSRSLTLANWQNLGRILHNQQFKITYQFSPQSLFIDDNSAYASEMAQGLGFFAWLQAHQSSEEGTARFFKGILTQAVLNENQAMGPISELDTQQLQQFREHFHNIMISNSAEHLDLFEPILLMEHFEVVDYMMKKGGKTWMLSVCQEASSRQPTVYLYEPNLEEIRISDDKVRAIKHSNLSIMSADDHLSRATYRMISLSDLSTSMGHPPQVLPSEPQ